MPVGLLKELLPDMPKGVPLMGLDVGSKTIGVSLSNADQSIATPVMTVMRRKFTVDIQEVAKIAEEYDVGGFVIGYPLNMDGSTGQACDRIMSFADEMNKCGALGSDPWIALWDERLSTYTVEDLVGGDVDIRKAKAEGLIDRLAAQIILQGALEYMTDHSA